MLILSLGVALWILAHLFKRLAPARRAMMGETAKGPIAVILLASVGLMVWGYLRADLVPVYMPLPGMGHANNALMLVAVFLYGVGGTKGTLYTRMRHPMLWGTVVWAVAHLLVNGDQAAIILFGGIGLWALVEMGLINLSAPWTAPAAGRGLKGDAMNVVGTLVLFGIIAMIHLWLGHSPFLGTYY